MTIDMSEEIILRAEQSRAEQSKDLYAIDVMKYIMAFCVIAIHTTPLKGIDNNIIYILYEAAVSIAVPFFFLSTGYLIGRKIQNKKEFDDVLVERQQKKVIRYYVIWTIVYLPLTILGFYKAGDEFVKSFVQFIRNVFFQGENYYSWPLWYLLSAVYGLTILKLLVESQKETKKFNFYSIIIIFFCVFMHFATDYIVNLNTTNNVVVTFSLLVEKTIRKGRIFSGVYYILLGNLIAKSEYHIGRIYLLAIFIASYLIVAFTSFLPIKMIMCITFFLLVISVKATGNGIYFRRTSTIMYYTHMIVFFVLNITVNKEMYGWVGFAFCCIVTNILAYVLNTGKFKNCKLLRTLFGPMAT